MELKECPFCGDDCFVSEVAGYDWVVGCNACMAVMRYLPTKEAAIKAWNKRHLTIKSSQSDNTDAECVCYGTDGHYHHSKCPKVS